MRAAHAAIDKMSRRCLLAVCVSIMMAGPAPVFGGEAAGEALKPGDAPWLDTRRSPDERAALAVAVMTLEEKYRLLHGPMALPHIGRDGVNVPIPPGAIPAAGFIPGIPRLRIPALYETDASLGVANPSGIRLNDVATALPASLALAATFDPSLAHRAGAMVGAEARAKGFNVLLGGGMNLTRDPRNGRNFEYLGEDPWLAGVMAGEAVRGTQDEHVIATVKHFALNANETDRGWLDARIERPALRGSDLLAFEIAIERGRPGAVMCSYNRVNGDYACGNHWLLTEVLKGDWHYEGWVMSDWGAVHAVSDAANGLDQESGEQVDDAVFFDTPLRDAVAHGSVSRARIDDMAHRILRSMFAIGIVDRPRADGCGAPEAIDYAADAAVALEIAREGIVLLKNEHGLLPLAHDVAKVAVIGGHADVGVLSGGGSAQVLPANGPFARFPEEGGKPGPRDGIYDPSAPLAMIQAAAPHASVRYDPGSSATAAAALAATADVAVVFVTRHQMEGVDAPDLGLPNGQDELIEAVARANPRTIVVLETGNPVVMPWLDHVSAVLASWYPGQEGGHAIADVLFGSVDPSGRLPITFPRAESELVRPVLPNLGAPPDARAHVDYTEGADVGYRWYSARGIQPLFAFGFGLSYSHFDYRDVRVSGGKTVTLSFEIVNDGRVQGADVPQIYLTSAAGRAVLRLIGFERVDLAPGESRRIAISADPRLLGFFDEGRHRWRARPGLYKVRIGRSAVELAEGGEAAINGF